MNTMNTTPESCDMIRDLAELYQEGLVSEGTGKAVRAHLKTCSACRKYFQESAAALHEEPETALRPEPATDGTELRMWQNLSEKMRRRRTLQIIGTGAVIGASSIMMAIGLIMVSKSMQGLK